LIDLHRGRCRGVSQRKAKLRTGEDLDGIRGSDSRTKHGQDGQPTGREHAVTVTRNRSPHLAKKVRAAALGATPT
jgi:hypothetical protein